MIPKKGIICGSFDVIHPGYVAMFKEIKNKCEDVYILLHDDPTIERPSKMKPVLSVEERRDILENFFIYPTILSYNTEAELLFLIKSIDPDIRFLGEEYMDKDYTGKEIGTLVHWIDRSHGWSTTKFKKAIANTI
jgi:glycerol-3-phosphate cytidylyltransferase